MSRGGIEDRANAGFEDAREALTLILSFDVLPESDDEYDVACEECPTFPATQRVRDSYDCADAIRAELGKK